MRFIAKILYIYMRLRRLWDLAESYDRSRKDDMLYLESLIDGTNKRIGDHVVVHSDVHWKGIQHQIIVVGRWRNRDHVRVFNLDAPTWTSLVDELHGIESHARVGVFDTPHSMEFSATYERERL